MIKSLRGCNVMLTGASGGLGGYIFEALVGEGANLALVAYPGLPLQEMAQSASKRGVRAVAIDSDLRFPEEQRRVVEWAQRELGSVDVLINNAGVEFTSLYHELTHDQISDVLRVNLEAPMMLSRLLLPDMLKRGRGHIVNMSSLAGKSGPALQEPYSATKAALVGFTYSLRASYRGTGVSASVISPGFVEAGIYTRICSAAGHPAPLLLRACKPEKVSKAVIRAILADKPEIIVNRYPIRPTLAFSLLFPSLGERLIASLGANDFFRDAARADKAPKHVQPLDERKTGQG